MGFNFFVLYLVGSFWYIFGNVKFKGMFRVVYIFCELCSIELFLWWIDVDGRFNSRNKFLFLNFCGLV